MEIRTNNRMSKSNNENSEKGRIRVPNRAPNKECKPFIKENRSFGQNKVQAKPFQSSGRPYKKNDESRERPFIKRPVVESRTLEKEEKSEYDAIEYFLEGRNPIREALKAERPMNKILVARGELEGSVRQILHSAREKKIVIQEVDRSRLDEISGSKSHQGIIAYVSAHEYVELADILRLAKGKGEPPFLIILDEISDPHNLGAIIRTAECCGAHGVVIPKRRAVGLTPVVAKASSGAIEYMPVARVTNIAVTIDELKKQGIWITGATMEGEVYYKADLKGPVAVVIGAEGTGLGRLIKEKCDFLVSIPLKGKIESLNSSVAAAILMYEVVKQRADRV